MDKVTLNHASANISPFAIDDEVNERVRVLTHLEVEKEHRGKGEAKALLEHIGKEADQAQIAIITEPKPYTKDGLKLKQLINLYKQSGYVELQEKPLILVRYPKQLTAT